MRGVWCFLPITLLYHNPTTQSIMADDASSLTSFFFYVFCIHPATAWILRPGRFERKKSIAYAIAFLAAIAAVKTGENLCLHLHVE